MGSNPSPQARATPKTLRPKNRSASVFDRTCPSRLIIDHLADKWAVLIVCRLVDGTLRFAELRRAIDGISQKMLTSTLRDLASVPPKVEYSLTPLGNSLVNKVEDLCRWAEANAGQILKAREAFDRRNTQRRVYAIHNSERLLPISRGLS
jgi:DNA-binding HxlR family transcriptional regulator